MSLNPLLKDIRKLWLNPKLTCNFPSPSCSSQLSCLFISTGEWFSFLATWVGWNSHPSLEFPTPNTICFAGIFIWQTLPPKHNWLVTCFQPGASSQLFPAICTRHPHWGKKSLLWCLSAWIWPAWTWPGSCCSCRTTTESLAAIPEMFW